MIDLIKKTVMISVGMAYLTKEKVEELAHEIIEKGKMSKKESKAFLEDLLDKSEETSKQVEAQMTTIVNDTLKKLNFATQEDVKGLKKEIKELRKMLKKKGETA